MSYTSLSTVKTMLGIADTSKDTILNQLISDADYTINSLLNIDGFDSGTVTETVNKRMIKDG